MRWLLTVFLGLLLGFASLSSSPALASTPAIFQIAISPAEDIGGLRTQALELTRKGQ